MADDYDNISEDEYEHWIPPRVALERLKSINRANAMEAIIARLAAGTLRVVARSLRAGEEDPDHFVFLRGYRLAQHDLTDVFWATGDLTIATDRLADAGYQHLRVPSDVPNVRVIGVRFEPTGIAEIEYQTGINARPLSAIRPHLSDDSANSGDERGTGQSAIPKKHPGGRPPNPLFEEAINAVWAELFDNALKPTLQQHIADRIAQWFVDNDHKEPGSTQIAQRARMIWKAWKENE